MRPLAILAVFLLLGVLGAGVWFAGRGGGDEVRPELAEPHAGAVAAPAEEPAASMVVPEVSGAESASRAAVEPTPAAAAQAEVPEDLAPKPAARLAPDARITGRVVDPLGRPVVGARVHTADPHRFLALRERQRPDAEARTDSAGRFELEVAPGEESVLVQADGFAPDRKRITVARGDTRDVGDWPLESGVVLEGIVLDPAHRPIEGAAIHRPFALDEPGLTVLTSDRGPLVTTTDESGRFRIASQEVGEYRFTAVAAGHPDGKFQGVTEMAGEQVTGIEVVLEPGAEIAGRVVDAPASELGGLVVRAFPVQTGEGIALLDFATDVPTQDSREADVEADGSFRLEGLKVDEEYRLTARAPGGDLLFDGSRTRPLVVQSGQTGVELEYSPGGTLVFQAVDATSGEPVTDLTVEAGSRFLQPLVGENGRPLENHPDGRVRFPGLRLDGAGERLTLAVHAVGYEDYRFEDIELEPNEIKELGILRLERIPVVRVTVTDAAGEPIEGARVNLAPEASGSGAVRTRSISMRREISDDGENAVMSIDDGSRSGETDGAGVCELSGFPGQGCVIRVREAAYAPYRSDTILLPEVDDYDHDVRLTAGGIVEVQVVDDAGVPVAEATVDHRAPDSADGAMALGDFAAPQRTNADGIARFEHLAAGEHLFRLNERAQSGTFAFVSDGSSEASREGWDAVDVSGGETYTLALVASPRARLVGRVSERGEPLAGATVRLRGENEDDHASGMRMLGGGGATAKTDPSGAFEFADEVAGSYVLEISHPDRAMPYELDVELRSGSNRENVDLPVTSVAGRVADLEGEAIAGALVQAKRYEGEGQRQMFMVMTMSSDGSGSTMISAGGAPPSTAVTDENGHYELRGVQPDTEIVVEASSDDHKTESSDPFRVAAGQERESVDVKLAAAGRLNVFATRDGEPTGNQIVRASFMGESETPVAPEIAVMQANGKVELKGLQEGLWNVRVSGFENPGGEGAPEQTVEVVAGEVKEARFEL